MPDNKPLKNNMEGMLYGVGVGPGDPELMTRKAVRIIEQGNVIAVPRTGRTDSVAYTIAEQAIPEIREKPVLELNMPMTRDEKVLENCHDEAAAQIKTLLDAGKNVVFLTLGDPSIYSTYTYIHTKVLGLGGKACFVPGVPSFCAVAAALNRSLVEKEQTLHLIPVTDENLDAGLDMPGTKVLMKAGHLLPEVKKELEKRGLTESAQMVQKCGMPEQVIYDEIGKADSDPEYFSIIMVKG